MAKLFVQVNTRQINTPDMWQCLANEIQVIHQILQNILPHISNSSSSESILHSTDWNSKQLPESLPWNLVTNNNSVYGSVALFLQTCCLKSHWACSWHLIRFPLTWLPHLSYQLPALHLQLTICRVITPKHSSLISKSCTEFGDKTKTIFETRNQPNQSNLMSLLWISFIILWEK